MKRTGTILLFFLFFLIAGGILTGCDVKRAESGGEQRVSVDEKEPDDLKDEALPQILDLSVKTVYTDKNIGEAYFSVEYPLYSLAAPSAEEYRELKNRLSAIHAEMQKHTENLQANFEQAVSERQNLSYYREGFVTRADTKVVSFYERSRQYEGRDSKLKEAEIHTRNIDASTGKELRFSDVFRDTESLPEQIAEAVKKAYPRQEFYPEMEKLIRQSVENNDGDVCFALGYGGVHIFAAEFLLSNEPGGHQVTLPYAADSSLVRTPYTKAPSEYILPLDYDMSYFPAGLPGGFSMSFLEDEEGMDPLWVIRMEDSETPVYEESLYDYEPNCFFVHIRGNNYLYVQLPSGDVSVMSDIYQLTKQKATLLDPIDSGILPETILHPNRIRMSLNRHIYAGSAMMAPCGVYRIGEDGRPQPASNVYDLSGNKLSLRKACRAKEADPKDPAAAGGMLELAAGTILQPYRTDMESWIDFITEDKQICRFGIDTFSDEMQLDDLGGLEDLFE
ncbi:MAG: hypothetical protein Q4A78_10100 [Peptostreptococcaceae bacterium]|nr:hypothetical protein [Peptostreptococcaceae bacterium]